MNNEIEKDLTVVVPNYNKSKYLKKCIESITEQTLKPYQIIIVDDCSTDESYDLLVQIQKQIPIVKVIFLDKNKGVSNARNVGISKTTTKYITFIDSDDFYYNKDKLKQEMMIIRKYQRKNKPVLAYSATALVSEDGSNIFAPPITLFDKFKFLSGKVKVQIISLIKQPRVPRDYIIEKDILLKVGAYSYPKNFYEDLDLLMRIAMSNTHFYCTFEYGTAYRMSTGGLSKRDKNEHAETVSQICDSYYNRLNILEKMLCSFLRCIRNIKQSIC